MARLWTCGLEENTLTARLEIVLAQGTPAISNTTFRSGSYALRCSGLGAGAVKGIRQTFAAAAGNGAYFFRVYVRAAAFPLIETSIIQLNDTANFTTPIVYVTLDSAGNLALFDEDGQIGSDSAALSTDTWYRVEVEFNRTGAAGSHIVKARVASPTDELTDTYTEFAAATNRDLSAGILTFNFGANLGSELDVTADLFFDDLAINDSTGSFQTSYPGIGEALNFHPSAAGDNANWTRGGTDSGNNWDQVDESPANDITDYVLSNTLGTIDDYNIPNMPAAMESTDIINVLHVNIRYRCDDQTGPDPDVTCRIKASASGTVEEGSSINAGSTTWNTNNSGTADMAATLTLYNLPGASTSPYTKADLDTTQIGIRESETDTHNVQVSALWLVVDHKPAILTAIPQKRLILQAVQRANI